MNHVRIRIHVPCCMLNFARVPSLLLASSLRGLQPPVEVPTKLQHVNLLEKLLTQNICVATSLKIKAGGLYPDLLLLCKVKVYEGKTLH